MRKDEYQKRLILPKTKKQVIDNLCKVYGLGKVYLDEEHTEDSLEFMIKNTTDQMEIDTLLIGCEAYLSYLWRSEDVILFSEINKSTVKSTTEILGKIHKVMQSYYLSEQYQNSVQRIYY